MSGRRLILLSQIRIDGGVQPRDAIGEATANEYAEAMGRISLLRRRSSARPARAKIRGGQWPA